MKRMETTDLEEYKQELCKQYGKSREEVESLAIIREAKEYFEHKPKCAEKEGGNDKERAF